MEVQNTYRGSDASVNIVVRRLMIKKSMVYGSLAQALFLAATDNCNLKGCKSANERFSYVENINNLLLAFKAGTLEGDVSKKDSLPYKINQALTGYVNGDIPAKDFALIMHRINDQYNVYNAGVMPSCMDTGTPKSDTAPGEGLAVGGINTKYFVANQYQNISQSKASAFQAHSGKIADRLDKLQTVTEELANKYTQDNPAKLAQAVIRDYAENTWGWSSHFKEQGQSFLREHSALLDKDELTAQDKTDLLTAIQTLRMQVQGSRDFNGMGSFSTRLLFLERKVDEFQPKVEQEVEVAR